MCFCTILSYIKYLIEDRDVAVYHLGMLCCGMSVSVFGSPLVSVVSKGQIADDDVLADKKANMPNITATSYKLLHTYQADTSSKAINSCGNMISPVVSYRDILCFAMQVKVIKDKSTECMTFSLCFGNFAVASQFFIYGYLIQDNNVKVG